MTHEESLEAALQRLVGKKLRKADVIWECPDTMSLGHQPEYVVRLRIETQPLKDFRDDLSAAITREAHDVGISTPVEVKLEPNPDAFSWSRRNEDKDVVAETQYKEWTWDVHPRASGYYRVNVRVIDTLLVGGKEIPFTVFSDGKTVKVEWNLWNFLTSAAELKAPEWFSALLVGAYLLLWKALAHVWKTMAARRAQRKSGTGSA